VQSVLLRLNKNTMCCSVLQCVAVCCSVLQCVAVCCSVLQCVKVKQKHHVTHPWVKCMIMYLLNQIEMYMSV